MDSLSYPTRFERCFEFLGNNIISNHKRHNHQAREYRRQSGAQRSGKKYTDSKLAHGWFQRPRHIQHMRDFQSLPVEAPASYGHDRATNNENQDGRNDGVIPLSLCICQTESEAD